MRKAIALTAALMLLVSCDYAETTVNTGQQAADQAREIAGGDADRNIEMARQMIRMGKREDAKRLLDSVAHSGTTLSEASAKKFELAMEELEAASR